MPLYNLITKLYYVHNGHLYMETKANLSEIHQMLAERNVDKDLRFSMQDQDTRYYYAWSGIHKELYQSHIRIITNKKIEIE